MYLVDEWLYDDDDLASGRLMEITRVIGVGYTIDSCLPCRDAGNAEEDCIQLNARSDQSSLSRIINLSNEVRSGVIQEHNNLSLLA